MTSTITHKSNTQEPYQFNSGRGYMTIQNKYTIARYGSIQNAQLYAEKAKLSFDDFCSKFYLEAMNLRKWNNNGEHCKSKGLEINVWHKTGESDNYEFYELYDGEGGTFYQRREKVCEACQNYQTNK